MSSPRSPLLVLALLAISAPLLAQAPHPRDDDAIREAVRKYVAAREAKDPEAIAPLFTADADQLVSDGTWRKGRDALVRGMLESSRKNPAKRSIAVESVRLLSPDVAIADGRYIQEAQTGGTDRQMWTTITLKREAEGWKIAAIRNMLPAAPAPAPKG
jgi:uncharacterized protein (TIGR02246 family)